MKLIDIDKIYFQILFTSQRINYMMPRVKSFWLKTRVKVVDKNAQCSCENIRDNAQYLSESTR